MGHAGYELHDRLSGPRRGALSARVDRLAPAARRRPAGDLRQRQHRWRFGHARQAARGEPGGAAAVAGPAGMRAAAGRLRRCGRALRQRMDRLPGRRRIPGAAARWQPVRFPRRLPRQLRRGGRQPAGDRLERTDAVRAGADDGAVPARLRRGVLAQRLGQDTGTDTPHRPAGGAFSLAEHGRSAGRGRRPRGAGGSPAFIPRLPPDCLLQPLHHQVCRGIPAETSPRRSSYSAGCTRESNKVHRLLLS